jgi:RNA-directed DNA polymerase
VNASQPKPFAISKWMVWEAYLKVKANKGAAGVDGESIEEFEKDLKGNLYKLWNRMSSGCYFPPPVRMVEIPKPEGRGVRILGVPTVADRIAQTVVQRYLEPIVEPKFHENSYGYRPGRSALEAIGKCRERCWKMDWVIDLDIRSFFDSLPWDLVLKAVAHHTNERWILLYVQRSLEAPMQRADGGLVTRESGSPQGSAISPVLANLLMHYAFDVWMARTFPGVPFERYCDDAVVHCASKGQAELVREAIAKRLRDCRLELHPVKTRIVYCKDANRRGSHEYTSFTFLGYEFRARRARTKNGRVFDSFSPGISTAASKAIRQTMRYWHLNRRSDKTLGDLAQMVNPIVRGWLNYYGRYYKSELNQSLRLLNEHLARWARQKYKRLRRHDGRARAFLVKVARRAPDLFVHWRQGLGPDGWVMGAV